MDLIQKHVKDLYWIRDLLIASDKQMSVKPLLGVASWDDAVCIDFSGKLVLSSDGPYTRRLVLKSALIHAAGDVVVKGAEPLFAQDMVIGGKEDVQKMVASLKIQSEAIKCPLCGGNTLYEKTQPRCSITVVGRLIVENPISDAGSQEEDIVCLLGEPIWGGQRQRINKTKTLWSTWYSALERIKVNASKDVTKGGLISTVYEMQHKSRKKIRLEKNQPYPVTRNLGNFLITLDEKNYEALKKLCEKTGCALEKIGVVSKPQEKKHCGDY
ncbi:MAG: hypothetical protein GF334_10665 [Candidatus Altiarchaeales archaeon]|nr:hypothetical protein [Candidatus Altiarchaeales archaeon]